MTREEAILWLKHINITDFGWDDYAMQDSQKEIRERCEQSIREAIDMAIEALQTDADCSTCKHKDKGWDSEECDSCCGNNNHYEAEYIIPRGDVMFTSEVVRCKDCRYYNPIDENKPYPCGYGMYMCNKDDFCSYGERR